MIKRRGWTILVLGWLALVLVGTLRPTPSELTPAGFCLICGQRGLADALLNVALFIPLGIGGRRIGLSPLRLLVLGVVLSGAIETAQFFIPGRDASIGDIIMNATGALVGVLLGPATGRLLRPDARLARRLAISWGLGVTAHIWLLTALLEPRLPGEPGALDLKPIAPDGEYYLGTVLSQRLDGETAAAGAMVRWESDPVGAAERLDVDLESAAFRSRYRPLVSMRVPEDTTTLLELGVTDFDLMLRLQRPIDRLRLSPADLWHEGAFTGFQGGDRFTVSVWRDGESYCLAVDQRQQCGHGFTTGSGWAFLSPVGWGNGGLDRGLDALWFGVLLFPLGYWGRTSRAFWGPAALVIGTALVAPAVSQLLQAPAPTLGGIAAGLVSGQAAARLLRRIRS